MEQLLFQALASLSPLGEFRPAVVPTPFVSRQIRDHRAQGSRQGADRGGNRATARRHRFRGDLVDELLERKPGERTSLRLSQTVLDHALIRIEGGHFVESEGAYR